ncbi:membrane protein [Longimycelium tulufanense]|uniref:Membrane protein n=1 Tax=Longimycelium tulufanense TaxID=907463 RepID=A0A8J3CDM8_9PSEU|nr:metallophosphoesterase [Longimycelium tulufanense]GGM78993.1 membrane protein [Longimycelium tulufanense]
MTVPVLPSLVFLAVVALVSGGIHWYLWKRLIRDTMAPGRWRRVGTGALVVLWVLLIAAAALTRRLPPDVGRFVAWPGYLWLAVVFYLLLILVVLELPRWLLLRRIRSRSMASEPAAVPVPVSTGGPGTIGGFEPTEPERPVAEPEKPGPDAGEASRRLFLARSTAAVAGLAAAGIVGFGMRSALGTPRVERVTVPLRRLDPGAAGMRIAVVSDLHLSPLLGRAHTERVVRVINDLEPDLVAVVGDLVDGSVENLGPAAAPLQDLASRHGSFFVTGNHDYFSGAEPWLRELERLGVHPLRNERTEIRHGSGVIDLAGVNDLVGRSVNDGPDFDLALGGRPDDRPVVLLAHQPVQVAEAVRHGVDLQLSGHTHGGQMVPFNLAVPLQQPVVAGLGRIDDTWLYVTRGVGFWGPPVRVGAPPDVTLVELAAG